MMKRMCKSLLAFLLCLMMTSAALAQDMLSATPTPMTTPVPTPKPPAASVLPQVGRELFIRNVVSVGETAYIMTYFGKEAQLWRWTAGMSDARRIGGDMLYAHHFVSMDEARQAADYNGNPDDAAFALSTIFSDGKTLYGYNGLTHAVFTIQDTEDGLICTPLVNLAKIISDAAYLQPSAACVVEGWLLWQGYDYRRGGEMLLAFNLRTGAVKQAVLPEAVKTISPWSDGQALVICTDSRDVAARNIYAYDPVQDTAEKLGHIGKDANVRRVAYSESLGMLIYQDKTRIMGWTPEGTEQLGYMPAGNNYADLFAAGNSVFFTTDSENLTSVAIHRDYAADHSITMLGGTMYTVLSQFYNRFQDVPVYYTDQKNGETWQEILSRETEMPDLWLCTSPGSYAEAVQAGALLDLSVYPEIRAYVEALYPPFRDLAEQNGGIYCVPVYAAGYDGWCINKEVMIAMGLTEADIPTTLEGMIAFAQRWNDEWAEKYPHFTLLNNTTNYRERLYYAIEAEWRQLCEKEGKAVAYGDPVYLALLEKLDAADFTQLDEALEQTDPEISEYKQALIWTGCKDVGNFDTYMEDFSDRIFLPVTLTADTPYVTMVQENRFWVVNARSENSEYVAALLAEAVQNLADKTAYTLRADKTEPVKNDDFDELMAYHLEYLAGLEAAVAQSVNQATALRRVEEEKAYIDSGLNGKIYLIQPSAIENYRNVIMPAAYVNVAAYRTADALADFEVLEHQYLHREITAQAFVKALDAQQK